MNLFDDVATDLNETTEETNIETPIEETDVEIEELENTDDDSGDIDEDAEYDATEEDIFIVNGEEFTREQLENAKDGETMRRSIQADFTKKQMALADEKKEVESLKDNLNSLAQQLEVLVNEDSSIDWDELEEDDPQEFIRLKKIADKRSAALKNAKSNLIPEKTEMSKEELAIEFNSLLEDNPDWVVKGEDGEATGMSQKYKDDMAALSEHAKELGFTNEEMTNFNRAPIIKALLNSMNSKKGSDKIEIAKKKLAPKQVKPTKAAKTEQVKSLFDY